MVVSAERERQTFQAKLAFEKKSTRSKSHVTISKLECVRKIHSRMEVMCLRLHRC